MERNSARAELKRQNTIKRIVLACSVVIVVVLAGIGTTKLTHHFDNGSAQISQTVKTNKKKQQTNELSLVMVGDNLIHMPLISDAQEEDGSLNFDGLYAEMASYFQAADLSVIVQETILENRLATLAIPCLTPLKRLATRLQMLDLTLCFLPQTMRLTKEKKGL